MAKVIILGGEGVGKSILLTVLAETYRGKNGSDYFLEAKNKDAALFSQFNWNLLTEKHEWPPPTPPSAYKKLLWQLHVGGDSPRAIDLICSDFAGETFREVFGRDNATSREAIELTEHIQTADAILVLINLAFLLDENDIERRVENDWSIKSCLDRIAQSGNKRYCIIFTQIDRYYNLFAEVENSCRRLLDKYFPQIAGVYPGIDIIPVAAVNRTDLSDREGGAIREIPAKEFGSDNLDEIMKWISQTPEGQPSIPGDSPKRYSKSLRKALKWTLIFVVIAFVSGFICGASNVDFFGWIAVLSGFSAFIALVTAGIRTVEYSRAKYAMWATKENSPKRL